MRRTELVGHFKSLVSHTEPRYVRVVRVCHYVECDWLRHLPTQVIASRKVAHVYRGVNLGSYWQENCLFFLVKTACLFNSLNSMRAVFDAFPDFSDFF